MDDKFILAFSIGILSIPAFMLIGTLLQAAQQSVQRTLANTWRFLVALFRRQSR